MKKSPAFGNNDFGVSFFILHPSSFILSSVVRKGGHWRGEEEIGGRKKNLKPQTERRKNTLSF
jgi:hypothetical protein